MWRDSFEEAKDENGIHIPEATKLPNFYSEYCEKNGVNIKLYKGTTTLGFKFRHGIIIAVDSRATAGSYIASQSVKKVIEINDRLLGTMAGGAADCAYWERRLAYQCRLYELENGRRVTVRTASKMLLNTVQNYHRLGLSMGTMIAGWDEHTGPALFYVDNDGVHLENDVFCVGSGATYAYGVLDRGYSAELSVEEAIELGKKAIFHATFRDAMSGGSVLIYHIKEDGWTRVGRFDTFGLQAQYLQS